MTGDFNSINAGKQGFRPRGYGRGSRPGRIA
jgi:hypothetical protein